MENSGNGYMQGIFPCLLRQCSSFHQELSQYNRLIDKLKLGDSMECIHSSRCCVGISLGGFL